MLTKSDVKQIRGVVETVVDTRLKPIKKQLNVVEKKVDVLEMKIEVVNNKVDKVQKELVQTIEESQEDTIKALSDLIHVGYNSHEKRIKRIENHLQFPQST